MNQTGLQLRAASVADAALLANIHIQCFPNYWNSAAFTDFFSVSGTYALLAEGRQTMGMAVYRVQFEQADILTLAVLPDFRRSGVALTLLEEAIRQAASKGCQKMFLDVEDGNVAAIALYEGFGFVHTARRKLYYRQKNGSFTDALVMTKQLPVASGPLPV